MGHFGQLYPDMAGPDKRQDTTYHRISDRQGSNSFTGGKRSTPEEILAYATKVLNRETRWRAMEGNQRWKREKEKQKLPSNRRKSSCTTCSRKQLAELAELAESEAKAKEQAEKKKNKGVKDEKSPKLYTHTWDVCIAVATKSKKPSLRQLLSRYFKIFYFVFKDV